MKRILRSCLAVLTATTVISAGLITTGATAANAAVPIPVADVIDIDFADGTPTDKAHNRTLSTLSEPVIGINPDLARYTSTFDGIDDAYKYDFTGAYAAINQKMTVECDFRFDGELVKGEKNICSNKQAGGFTMAVNGSTLSFQVHVDGSYMSASSTIDANQWYHTVGVFDGSTVSLYVNGVLAAATAAAGTMTTPSTGAHHFVVGADSKVNGTEFFAKATVSTARVFGSALTADQIGALNTEFWAGPAVPSADILDVDFTTGTAVDAAQNLTATTWGKPSISNNGSLAKNVAEFNGTSAYSYPMGTEYAKIDDGFTLECVFQYTGDFPSAGSETNLCANKEAGGFALAMYGTDLTFTVHSDGGYKAAKSTTKIEKGRWYNATGVFADNRVRLYLNGSLVGDVAAGSTMTPPPNARAHNLVLGADSSAGNVQLHSPSAVSDARLYTGGITAVQAAALNRSTFLELDRTLAISSTFPAHGGTLDSAQPFTIEYTTPNEFAPMSTYTLDGVTIRPGQIIGAGLAAGEHTIHLEARNVFGGTVSQDVVFTTPNIQVPGGTWTGQGQGSVTLSANASNPSGGDVITTFSEAAATLGSGTVQGTITQTPSTLEFTYTDGAAISDALIPGDGAEAPSAAVEGEDGFPFQRFDVPASGTVDSQVLRWTGTIDSTRLATMHAWNAATSAWQAVSSGRGVMDGQLTLSATITGEFVDAGQVHVLVTAEDPFADDLVKSVDDAFDSPDSYDFSIAHFTDTQYLSEGAVERGTAQERDAFARAYTAIPEWIAANADEKKIVYTGHTGDVIEDWHAATYADPAAQEVIARQQFEFASAAQKILDDAGMPNGVTPGNHDNRTGTDNGADNVYNDYFGADRYEALAASDAWKEKGVTYQAWKPGDNDNHFDLFSAGGLDFIALYLGFEVSQEEIDWASGVLDQYTDRNAILLTHAYNRPSPNADGRGAAFSNDGQRLTTGILEQHDNVFLVLSGHEHGVSIEVKKDVGQAGNDVVELLADYQFYEVSAEELGLSGVGGNTDSSMLRLGSAFMRLLQFDVDRSELSIDTYSPFLANFGASEYDDESRYNGTEDDTRLPIQLETRKTSFATDALVLVTPTETVIGEQTARSGWPASVTWAGLTEGQTYAWSAVSRDASSGVAIATGSVRQFATFVATAAGTDTIAPVITLPEAVTTILVGDTFNPLDGVTAVDNTDGDVIGAIEVMGSVDTAAAGVHTLTYVVQDTNGNQSIASRSVVVQAQAGVDPADPADPGTDPGTDPADPGSEPEPDPANPGAGTNDSAAPAGSVPGSAPHGEDLAQTGFDGLWIGASALALLILGLGAFGLRRKAL